jgi:hypothetical protein
LDAAAALAAIRPEINRRVRDARDAALDEAAATVDDIGSELTILWRQGRKSDSYLEGRAVAFDQCAGAIRALKLSSVPPDADP